MTMTTIEDNVLTLDVGRPAAPSTDRRIGAILVEDGKLTEEHAKEIIDLQRKDGLRFGEAALRLGLVNEEDLQFALAKQYDVPQIEPSEAGLSTELVAAYARAHRRVEELRALRTQLLIRWFNGVNPRRVLAIASAASGEGRTYLAANLAIVFSQLGERTLLIDADLRGPRQHRLFNIPDRIGLSAVLSGRANGNAIVPIPGFSDLSLLPAGALPPNPQELLSRAMLGRLLKEMETQFDVILIDTPPAKLYADAQSVAYHSGGAVVLARKNHSRMGDTTEVVRDLSDAGAQVVGTVFNVF